MTPFYPSESLRQGLLEEVLKEYMQRLDRGECVNREEFLAQHPELAEELRSYFAGSDELERLGGRAPGDTERLLHSHRRPGPDPLAEASPGGEGPRRIGDYDLVEQIGQGGMGVIYKARQLRPQRLVALKMIRPGRLASPADVLRFRAEAEAAASLDHPNIVPIYEVGEHQGVHYFSMKLVEGGSLARHLPRLASEVRTGVALVAEVARAVHYAHQRCLLHRDLKPANVLLDGQGRPHVTDFGLVKRLANPEAGAGDPSLTQPGMIVGTPSYMAPEQAAARGGVSTAADVYSLGAILYELLTGRPPFRGETPLDTLVQLREREPAPPRTVNRQVDRDLETVCLKCLAREPHKRYASAEALADDLERWRRGEPIQARPVGRCERALKWARRRPALAILAALLLVVSVVGFAGVYLQWRRAEGEYQNAAARAKEKQRTAYAHGISLAHAKWLAGDAGAAGKLLAASSSGLSGWEWHYLRRLFRVRQLTTQEGHTDGVLAIAFSPDGTRVASVGPRGTVKVWGPRAKGREFILGGKAGTITAVAFSPDGRRLASGGADGTVHLWDVASGKRLATLQGQAVGVTCLAFHPRAPLLAATGGNPSQGELKVWDLTTRKVLASRICDNTFTALAFSPDGEFLVTAGLKKEVETWEVTSLNPLGTFEEKPGSKFYWTCVAFNNDGSLVAAGSSVGLVRAWRTKTRKEFFSVLTREQAGVSGLAFSGQGARFLAAATTDNTVQVWITQTAKPAFTLRGHSRPVTALACSLDGRCLASGSLDGTMKLWDISRRDDQLTFRTPNLGFTSISFSPDGRLLAAGTRDKALKVWDLKKALTAGDQATKKAVVIVPHLPGSVNGVAFGPRGGPLAFACGDGTVRLWDVSTGRERRCLRGHRGPVHALAYNPDGSQLASAGEDGTVRLWDMATGREASRLRCGGRAVYAIAFSPDGSQLASTGEGGTVRLWDVAAARERLYLRGHDGPVYAVAFHPNGRLLATAGQDEAIRVWDAATGGPPVQTMTGHEGAVWGLAYGPGGRLASGGADRTLRLWDEDGRELLALRGHTEGLRAVAFSPDGHRLASAGDDRAIKIWDGSPIDQAKKKD